MIKQLSALLLLGLASLALAAPADTVEGPNSFADLAGVMVYQNLYFAGQPSPEALAAAKADGVTLVINMRTEAEMRYDEQAAAQALDLQYQQIPIAGANGFNPENLGQLSALVTNHGDGKILVHCASGNRAGGWLGHYLASQQGVNVDQAFAAARKAGLRSDAIETSLRDLLDHQP